MTHLLLPQGEGTTCGLGNWRYESDADINEVDCQACIDIHEDECNAYMQTNYPEESTR